MDEARTSIEEADDRGLAPLKSVVFVTRALPHYRVSFHNLVRASLRDEGVRYSLHYSDSAPEEQLKGDGGAPPWAQAVPIQYFGPSANSFVYQTVGRSAWQADLTVIGQHNKHLHNYPLLLNSMVGRPPKLAFFGHGRGYQANNPDGVSEQFKRFWTNKVDWWFTYTESGAMAVERTGFPRGRITVFNNAIDTSAIGRSLADIGEEEIHKLRHDLVAGSEHVGVYVGGIYVEKRIAFMIEAAKAIRRRIPDFHLLVIGGGPDAGLVQQAAADHTWIHALGPRFGRDKTLLMRLAKALLMPGLVGLAVLDAFAYGTPMVATALPYHSPEFDYLRHGENGIIVASAGDAEAYAAAVADVLLDDALRTRLNRAAARDAQFYTTENMAKRFTAGVLQALRADRYRASR